jgi:hypothetical protein
MDSTKTRAPLRKPGGSALGTTVHNPTATHAAGDNGAGARTAGEKITAEKIAAEHGAAAPRTHDLPSNLLVPPVPPPPPHLDDYESIAGAAQIDALRFLARELKGKTIKMVNSTSVGGGVAEMLNRLVPLLSELEVPTHWDVITGGNDFFEVTKAFHNALHGSPYELTQNAKDIFLMYNEQNLQRMKFEEGMVVIHDPQPAALIRAKEEDRGKMGMAMPHRPLQPASSALGVPALVY